MFDNSLKIRMNFKLFNIFVFYLIVTLFISGCGNKGKKLDPNRPLSAEEKRKRNIKEGGGVSLKGIIGGVGGTNYEFSTSNPMWRATLETLDFLPLTTVDYSGGIVITDWYSEENSKDSIKITVRFLSNEIRSNSIKVIVHKKNCKVSSNCSTTISSNGQIQDELLSTILKKASLLEKKDKEKK